MIRVLGIETSCDETAAAVVADGRTILSNIVYSQISIHREFGGVVPEIASRRHLEKIQGVVEEAVKEAGISFQDLSAIAVTQGPGLVGPLLVGVSFAKALSLALGKPLLGIHHLDGHVCANYLAEKELTPPFLALILSGGHSHFLEVSDYGAYHVLGGTRDDALGEAFDKVARLLGLPYPGGPEVEALARAGQPVIPLPRALLKEETLDFSFSGMKSAVRQVVIREKEWSEGKKSDIAASFQEAAFDVLIEKIRRALKQTGQKRLVLAGGVASNQRLRERLREISAEVLLPPPAFCTDNGAMIASAGYFKFIRGECSDYSLNATPSFDLLSTGNR